MKPLTKSLLLLAGLVGLTICAHAAQTQKAPADTAPAASAPTNVYRTIKAGSYRRPGSTTKVFFRGSDLMSQAVGTARVSNKGNRVEVEADFTGMDDASKFGLEYLTYVLWAISPEGRAENLGELVIKSGAASVKAITNMQAFGMVVTAEPYFAVTQPGNLVALENLFTPQSAGATESIDAKYELLARGAYSSTNTRIDNAIFGIDPRTPREVFEARNAVRIARVAQADKFASETMKKAEWQLQNAEDAYRRKSDKKAVESAARDAIETAEEARVMAVQKKAEEDAQARALAEKQAAEEREARARAEAEEQVRKREEAEKSRVAAEQAKEEAERVRHEAELAAQEAAKQKALAEQAAAEAARQTEAARLATEQARQQQAAAQAEAEKARLAAQRAETEKAELRKQLLDQLNSVLQTRDSARGLIVNMSDVLFDSGSYTLRAGAREKLAKVSGIVLAHPGLSLQVEGHTDSVGGDEFNQQLSEHRASMVRDFLLDQGVQPQFITFRGFGKMQPVATNDTPEGRQKNRRVEIVVNGDAIGNTATSADAKLSDPQ